MIKKIFIIIRAKLRDKDSLKEEWYLNRLDICNTCPFNSKSQKENRNIKYYIYKILNLGEYFCTICGCEIKAKASEEMETCSLKDIDKDPKW